MVKQKLPFLPDGSTIIPGLGITLDTKLDNLITEQYYYLQKYTQLSDVDVETEAKYTPLQRMLIAELSAYHGINDKALTNVAGSAGTEGDGGKRIKKGKADVVEAEFEYQKSKDGNFLGGTTEELKANFARRACEISAQLGYNLPFCIMLGLCSKKEEPIPFMFIDNPSPKRC